MFSANIFTLYPDVFPGVLGQGIYEKASKNNIWKLNVKNIIHIKTNQLIITYLLFMHYTPITLSLYLILLLKDFWAKIY